MKYLKDYGVIKMGKDKQLYLLLETRKSLKKILDEAIRRSKFYEKCAEHYSIRLHDLDEAIKEMRDAK